MAKIIHQRKQLPQLPEALFDLHRTTRPRYNPQHKYYLSCDILPLSVNDQLNLIFSHWQHFVRMHALMDDLY